MKQNFEKSLKKLMQSTTICAVVFIFAAAFSSCGGDSEPQTTNADNDLISGYWECTTLSAKSVDSYMLSFTDGSFCQFWEWHNGKSLRSNTSYNFDSKSQTLTLENRNEYHSGVFYLAIIDSRTLEITIPGYGVVQLTKAQKWSIPAFANLNEEEWKPNNASIAGIYKSIEEYENESLHNYMLKADGTGVYIKGSLGKPIYEKHPLIYCFVPTVADKSRGYLVMQVANERVNTYLLSIPDKSDNAICSFDDAMFRYYPNN